MVTARTSADEIAETHRTRLAEEVRSLEVRRDALSRNAELLERYSVRVPALRRSVAG